jgi:hypothetical protein
VMYPPSAPPPSSAAGLGRGGEPSSSIGGGGTNSNARGSPASSVFLFASATAARVFCAAAPRVLADMCDRPPPRPPVSLAPFVQRGSLDEVSLLLVEEALAEVGKVISSEADRAAAAAVGCDGMAVDNDDGSAAAGRLKLPSLTVAETALKVRELTRCAHARRSALSLCGCPLARRAYSSLSPHLFGSLPLPQFVALYLRTHNPRFQADAKQAAARRAALEQFRRDCAAHARVAAAAPRGAGAGAIRALRDESGSSGSCEAEAAPGAVAAQDIAFRESADHFDCLASMTRDDLYTRFMTS